MKPNPDWRYLAGLWDGEGCVTVCCVLKTRADGSRYEYWNVRLNMSNTCEPLIRSLAEEFGGRAFPGKTSYKSRKLAHQWSVFNSKECAFILRNILPFLRYKHEEAKLAIEYFDGVAKHMRGPSSFLPDEECERRNRLALEIRALPGRRKNNHSNGHVMLPRAKRERTKSGMYV
jgi:hypothetical protein